MSVLSAYAQPILFFEGRNEPWLMKVFKQGRNPYFLDLCANAASHNPPFPPVPAYVSVTAIFLLYNKQCRTGNENTSLLQEITAIDKENFRRYNVTVDMDVVTDRGFIL